MRYSKKQREEMGNVRLKTHNFINSDLTSAISRTKRFPIRKKQRKLDGISNNPNREALKKNSINELTIRGDLEICNSDRSTYWSNR